MTLEELAELEPAESWDGAETDLERRFEGWIQTLAADRLVGIAAARACVELALPVAVTSSAASGLDFGGPHHDWGHPIGLTSAQQLEAVRALMDTGTALPKHTADYTRQLNVWDEDLRPLSGDPGSWFTYFVEATNLLVMACLHDDGAGPYGEPSRRSCASRAAVCAFKSMHTSDTDRETDLRGLIDAVEAAVHE